jgi:hypothetical protein
MAWVKIPPENHPLFHAALPGAAMFDPMGDGRARSDKVMLPEAAMSNAPELRRWLERAFDFASRLPPKAPKKAKAAAKRKKS